MDHEPINMNQTYQNRNKRKKCIKVMFTFYKRIDCVHCVRNVNKARVPFTPISIEICIFVTIPLFVCESIWLPLLLLCIKHWHERAVCITAKIRCDEFPFQFGIQAMSQHSLVSVCGTFGRTIESVSLSFWPFHLIKRHFHFYGV